ncbi:MAG: hypothetical protein FJW39_05785 [Acidobacteria bacterium]|nr:hypothetical protein [Acidobacteriota bacterium]
MSFRNLSILIAMPLFADEVNRKVFLNPHGSLTEASPRPAGSIAETFLRSAVNLGPEGLAGTFVAKEYKTAHNGVTHFVYRQRFQGIEVYNADFTVNLDRDGRVLSAGGNLYPRPTGALPPQLSQKAASAARTAARAVSQPDWAPAGPAPELVWFGVNGLLRPAWVVETLGEDGISRSNLVVDYETERILATESMTYFQNPQGLVFERGTPRPNPQPGRVLDTPPPFVSRTMQSFTGDPTASPRGWVSGGRTAGNNVIAGLNPLGIIFLETPTLSFSTGGEFTPPLDLGPGAPPLYTFGDAATVNLFYWMNRTHDLFYAAGFDEAAGNFQEDNFGRGGSGGDAIRAYSHFGSGGQIAAQLNNAFFQWRRPEDGSPSMIAMYLGSSRGEFTDGSYDGDVIVHEYGHGVSARLVRRNYTTFQGGSMGEAWSDFFALEFLSPEGAPVDGVYGAAEYLFNAFGTGLRTRPVSTRMDVNPLTFADLGRVISFPQVHADGEIWVQALWDIRANLIRQFGEREGRRRVRLLVIDGMKLSPPAPSMVDMRDAILLADRVGFRGESQEQIWAGFAKRGLGVLAQSFSAASTHVSPSFDTPSRTAAIRFYEDSYYQGEAVRVILHDANLAGAFTSVILTSTSGDLEPLVLDRTGAVYIGSLPTSPFAGPQRNGVLNLSLGDSITAHYRDPDTGSGPRDIEHTAPTSLTYSTFSSPPRPFTFSNEVNLNFRAGQGAFRRVELPFDFPFYGQTYRSVRLWSDGLLSFGTANPGFCRDPIEFSKVTAIAPLWLFMTTAGAVQPNESVYLSSAPGSVTFRWVGETLPILAPPTPVNFAVTLNENGTIEFRYGPGNTSLSQGLQSAACGILAPMIGISSGRETMTQTAPGTYGRVNLENAPVVAMIPAENPPSLPSGELTQPTAGQTVQSILSGRGTLASFNDGIRRADVLIDGGYRAGAALAINPRLPQCSGVPNMNCYDLTFDLDVNALGLSPGAHRIQLRVANFGGGFTDIPAEPVEFTVEPGEAAPPAGAVETPGGGETLRGAIPIRGWAAAGSLRVTAVDVLVDGLTVGRAVYGAARPDVCDGLNPRPVNCPGVGFTFTWNSASANLPFADGPHGLQIRVLDQTGRMTLLPETPVTINLENGGNQLPVGVLVTPANGDRVSGVTRIWGYAWDPDGRIVNATLFVDGEVIAAVPYGEPRPEQCEQLPDVARCPNIGFALEFDTRVLANGSHVLGIQLTDDRGSSVFIAGPNRRGINITVDNR